MALRGSWGRSALPVQSWPGAEVFPPQQMVQQIRTVLESYRDAGGQVRAEQLAGSGHGPFLDAAAPWSELFFAFLDSAEAARS